MTRKPHSLLPRDHGQEWALYTVAATSDKAFRYKAKGGPNFSSSFPVGRNCCTWICRDWVCWVPAWTAAGRPGLALGLKLVPCLESQKWLGLCLSTAGALSGLKSTSVCCPLFSLLARPSQPNLLCFFWDRNIGFGDNTFKKKYNYDSYQKLQNVLFQVKVYASTTFNKPPDA